MKYGNCIRSDIGHMNNENRRRHKQRINDEQFGIYRPLSPEATIELRGFLIPAKQEATRFLDRHRRQSAELTIPNDLGVTFVMRSRVKRAMGQGLLRRGFELGQMMRRIESEADLQDESLRILCGGLDWYSKYNRKLVTTFADSVASRHLERQSDIVTNVLADVQAGELPVMKPDHLTLLKYGRDGDRLDLSRKHRMAVADIVEERLCDEGFDSIMLQGLVVGESYSQPLDSKSWVA
jgi:hypothetical protein